MYKNVIKNALEYTRPFLISQLYYENKHITNESSTMIVLNKNGDILTTAKNADVFIDCKDYNEIYPPILKEISETKSKNIKKIEDKYGIKKDSIVGMHNILIDIADNPGQLEIIKHPYLDMAIIRIENKENLLVKNFPTFAKKNINVGSSSCCIGFALPEYQAFKYDEENYKITTNFEFMNFPIFPTDGIITRNIADKEGNIAMFEMSNLILNGMEGGPVLNKNGKINGLIIGSRTIQDSIGNIRLGLAINVETILKFLDNNGIDYEVENEKK